MKLEEKISRNDFLKKLGFTGASLFALYSLDSCVNEGSVNPATVTVDLSSSQYSALTKSGGYVVVNNMVVANNGGTYVAATISCSHEGKKQMTFRNGEWYCTAHGARFNTAGKGLNSNGSKGLTIYTTSLTGNTLTITT
ncbi:MAG: Rieske 2Fe-2S domain-containing protein [Cytophagaceae bacterium]|nr:Rieske 2Fe-2S domain-containing protein [Cytophagaceae bacterium]